MRTPFKKDQPQINNDQTARVFNRLQRACARVVVETDLKKTMSSADFKLPDSPLDTLVPEQTATVEVAPVKKKKKAKKVAPLEQTPMPQRRWSAMDWLKDWFRPQQYPESANRRIAPRYPFGKVHKDWDVSVGTSQWPVVIKDISQTGVGLLTGKWHKAGTPLEIQLVDAENETGFAVATKVVRVIQQPNGQWYLGCSLQGELDDKELEQFT